VLKGGLAAPVLRHGLPSKSGVNAALHTTAISARKVQFSF